MRTLRRQPAMIRQAWQLVTDQHPDYLLYEVERGYVLQLWGSNQVCLVLTGMPAWQLASILHRSNTAPYFTL